MKEVIDYYDKFVNYQAQFDLGGGRTKNKRILHALDQLKKYVPRNSEVLDIGCGIGHTSYFMAKALNCKVTAVDISIKTIEYARANNNHPNIYYDCGDILKRTEGGNFYDAITMIDVFEHIPKDRINKLMKFLNDEISIEGLVYLNIPDGRYQNYISSHERDLLQIIDETWYLSEILELFQQFSLTPIMISLYGINMLNQYVDIAFEKNYIITSKYRQAFKEKDK